MPKVGWNTPETIGLEGCARLPETPAFSWFCMPNETEGCTATAISDRLLLTNSHCVPADGQTRAVRALFFLGFESENREALAATQGVLVELPAIEQSERLDYAVLRLSAPITDYEPLRIAAVRDPDTAEQLVILGFPYGLPLSVARRNCRTTDRPIQADTMLHLCRTYRGNSGSLLFSDDWSLVGLHHRGSYDPDTGERQELSQGIRMTAIVADSRLLRDLLGSSLGVDVAPGPSPDPYAAAEAALGLDLAARRAIQRDLTALGFDTGGVDGVYGPRTRRAISAWQSRNDLHATDYLVLDQIESIARQALDMPRAAATRRPVAVDSTLPAEMTRQSARPGQLCTMYEGELQCF